MAPRCWRRAAVALAWTAAAAAAQAHPHGGIDCRARVQMAGGQLERIEAELRLDAWHAREALALVRDPASGAPDPQRLERLTFALRLQMGRLGWLLTLRAGDAEVPMSAGAPRVEVQGDAVRVQVALAPAAGPQPAGPWTLQCGDPTFYWLAAFGATPVPGAPQPVSDAAAVQVAGCGAPARAVPSAAGTGAAQWSCDPVAQAFDKSETALPN